MEKLLNPSITKRNLLVASLFITSFEMLKSSIQDKIKNFLCEMTMNIEGEIKDKITDEYKTEVLDRIIPDINKNNKEYHLFYSSCLWLKDNDVITQNDFDDVQEIRKERNLISHNLLALLTDDNINLNIELLKKSQKLLSKIEKWWLMNVEIIINSNFDGMNINENEIESGSTILLNYLMEIAENEINM